MNKKRLVALLAAAVMVLGTVPVFAAETSGSGTVINEATEGALTITGDATVNDVAKEDKYIVTLPTAEAFDFYVDPYGLVDAATGTAVDIVDEVTGQGAIIVKDDALAVIKNQSNVDVVVDVDITIDSTGGALNLVTVQEEVAPEDDTDNNMFLALVPGTTKAYDAATYVATGEAIAIESAGTTAQFLLEKAVYEVIVTDEGLDYQISPEEDNFDAVAFKLGGSINKAADWSGFTAEKGGYISFEVVFDIAKADGEVVDEATALHGVVEGTDIAEYTPVAGTVSGPTVQEEVAYVKTTSTYWQLFTAETKVVGDSFDTSKATVTVNGTAVDWSSAVTACASRLKVSDVAAALDMGTALAEGDYEVVITVEGGSVYKATVTVD